jgi:hypothetical protein
LLRELHTDESLGAQTPRHAFVSLLPQEQTECSLPVSAATTNFLVVAIETLREARMDDAPNVVDIDAEAESRGANRHVSLWETMFAASELANCMSALRFPGIPCHFRDSRNPKVAYGGLEMVDVLFRGGV